jgi:hypothetical protein
VAVRLSLPAASVDSNNVATPLAFKAELPSVIEPIENVTVPVGVAAAPELTVAVRITDCS